MDLCGVVCILSDPKLLHPFPVYIWFRNIYTIFNLFLDELLGSRGWSLIWGWAGDEEKLSIQPDWRSGTLHQVELIFTCLSRVSNFHLQLPSTPVSNLFLFSVKTGCDMTCVSFTLISLSPIKKLELPGWASVNHARISISKHETL